MLKITRTKRGSSYHVAPVATTVALCGARVWLTDSDTTEFRFGVVDASLCTRCRDAVLKAEGDTIFLGYDEKAVEPFVLLAYARRHPEWTEPLGLATWRETLAESLARADREGFQNV